MAATSREARRERIRELVDRFNADHERWLDELPEGIVIATDPGWPGGGSFQGRDDIGSFVGEFVEAWSSIELVVGELDDAGTYSLVGPARWVGRGSSSGIDTTFDFSAVWVFDDHDELRVAQFLFSDREAREFAAVH